MASEKQIEAFNNALTGRQFPAGTDTGALRERFATLPVGEASRWLERAFELPKGEDSGAPVPF